MSSSQCPLETRIYKSSVIKHYKGGICLQSGHDSFVSRYILRRGISKRLFIETTARLFCDHVLNLQNVDFEYTLEIFRIFIMYSDSQAKIQKVDQPNANSPHIQRDWT